MADDGTITIDPILIEWIGLCLLVSDQSGPDAFQRWAFTVGMDGTLEERLLRGRVAWVQGREMWGKKDATLP